MVKRDSSTSLISTPSSIQQHAETTFFCYKLTTESPNEDQGHAEYHTEVYDSLKKPKQQQQQQQQLKIEPPIGDFTGKNQVAKNSNNNDLSLTLFDDKEDNSEDLGNGNDIDGGNNDDVPPAKENIEYRDWFRVYEHNNNNNQKKRWLYFYKRDRLLMCTLLIASIISLIVFVSFVYQQGQRKSEDNQRMINYLSKKLDFVNQELQSFKDVSQTTTKMPGLKSREVFRLETHVQQQNGFSGKFDSAQEKVNNERIIIKLVGDQGIEKSQPGRPIHNWQKKLMRGNITFFNGRLIKIIAPGYYIVQARMYFKENHQFREANLDFGVVKRSLGEPEKWLAATTVPKKNCLPACGSSLIEIVHLRKGDCLSVQTKSSGQQFGMYKDKASFSVRKI